jgi:uncharacterized protein YaaQ
MKMVMAIVQAEDVSNVTNALVDAGHRVTRIATTGGFLRRENVSLLLGVEDEKIDEVMRTIQQSGRHRKSTVSMPVQQPEGANAQSINVDVGGATIFVLDIERFEHY